MTRRGDGAAVPRHWRVLAACTVIAVGCISPDTLSTDLSAHARAMTYEAVYVHKRAVELYKEGKTTEAIIVAEKSVALLEAALGDTHPCVAVPLHSLAVFHQTQGAYAKAEPLYLRVIAIHEKALTANDAGLVQVLDELAELYLQWGAYDKAEPLYVRALAIREQVEGSARATAVMEGLNHLAEVFEKQGAYAKAEPLYRRSLELAQTERGPKHADVARGLNGLAMLYWDMGTYERAAPLLVRALDIRQNLLAEISRFLPAKLDGEAFSANLPDIAPTRPPRYGETLNSALSRELALNAYTTAVGQMTTAAVRGLSNLDELVSVTNPNTIADPLRVGTVNVFDTVVESMRSEVMESRGNLAQLYATTGDYKRAEALLASTLQDREKTLGEAHPDLTNSLNDLAQLYQTQGAYARAEPLLQRVQSAREKALGPAHPDVARSLNNLALLYRLQGAPAKAEPLLVRSVAIFEKALGPTHPDVARSLNNLAALYHDQGQYGAAEPLYARAVDIMSSTPGAHPDTLHYLNNLAVLYHAMGEHDKSESLMVRAAEMRESWLNVELVRLSAPRKRALMILLQQETDSMVSLHADLTPDSERAFDLALTTVLRRKGLALESLLDNQAALRAHLTPKIRTDLNRLTAASSKLSTLLHAPLGAGNASARASAIALVRDHIEALESELNAEGAELHAQSQVVAADKVAEALPPAAALIEFKRYRRFDARHDLQHWQEPRYVAYILRHGAPRQWVALGAAAPIDAAVDAVLAEMHRGTNVDVTKAALQHLDALVFAPLRDRLAGISHVIVSPDSKLNLVPFDALVDAQGRYELEHRLISYVTSGRDLVRRGARLPPRSPATIVAAPEYGRGGRFVRLANAAAEAAEVSAHFPGARMLTGNQATKSAFATIAGPAILHVATHGFFARGVAAAAPVKVPPGLPPMPALGSTDRAMYIDGVFAPARPAGFDDPGEALDRAGLALANANLGPDGIVTAREIANYDWWGTRLVVLSACETGVGAVPSGEGVYGLRRALALAGTESQIVSLWNVNDASVRALMRGFYDQLARGVARAEALRLAKLRMLQQPAFAHPYYWAPFIADGDWTALGNVGVARQ